MADERVVKKETDFWGKEKEVIYEDGRKVGEITTEQRGGFFGFGDKTHRVERDTDGKERSYTKNEERGGFFGIGDEPTQVRYDPDGHEIGTSKIEARGGFFGLGEEHVRVERDTDGRETGETRWERRGGFFGLGEERVRVTRREPSSTRNASRSTSSAHSGGYSGGGGGTASRSGGLSSLLWPAIILVIIGLLVAPHLGSQKSTPAPVSTVDLEAARKARAEIIERFRFENWAVGQSLNFSSRAFQFCTRPCNQGASEGVAIKLASITRQSRNTIVFEFEATAGPKRAKLVGGFENRARSDFLLFVYEDSFTELGYGSSKKQYPYAEAIHLLDDHGRQIEALDGIEGLATSEFNSHATRAILPFGSASRFQVTFPVPKGTSSSLTFVAPSLHGHQSAWQWRLYDADR